MADISPDPFLQAYAAIWKALAANAKWLALVKIGNRIRLDETFPPGQKGLRSRADWPQAALIPGEGQWTLTRTNPTSQCTRMYQLVLASGVKQYSQAHSQAEWQTYRALAKASLTLDLSFVVEFTYGTFTFTNDPVPELAGSAGYMTAMPLRVVFSIPTTALTVD